jgi:hypothetical protein
MPATRKHGDYGVPEGIKRKEREYEERRKIREEEEKKMAAEETDIASDSEEDEPSPKRHDHHQVEEVIDLSSADSQEDEIPVIVIDESESEDSDDESSEDDYENDSSVDDEDAEMSGFNGPDYDYDPENSDSEAVSDEPPEVPGFPQFKVNLQVREFIDNICPAVEHTTRFHPTPELCVISVNYDDGAGKSCILISWEVIDEIDLLVDFSHVPFEIMDVKTHRRNGEFFVSALDEFNETHISHFR